MTAPAGPPRPAAAKKVLAQSPPMDIYIALVHHPVLNRAGNVVATAVTNIDIHDLARAARTYGVSGYFLVTPIEQQRAMVSRIAAHWQGKIGRAHV